MSPSRALHCPFARNTARKQQPAAEHGAVIMAYGRSGRQDALQVRGSPGCGARGTGARALHSLSTVTCALVLAVLACVAPAAASSGYSCGTAARPCVPPACVCPSSASPAGLARESTPQFVVLSFDDAVTVSVRAPDCHALHALGGAPYDPCNPSNACNPVNCGCARACGCGRRPASSTQ